MKALSFKKGIHPPYCKEATQHRPIQMLMPKGELIFPMQQHIGAPCTPLVKKGDYVLVGQKIGEPTSFVGAPIHSSVSGSVKVVEHRKVSNGNKVMSVVVMNDGEYKEIEGMRGVADYTKLSHKELTEMIKEAGVVGMGGATFPSHVKLSPPEDKVITSIIVNAAECEPYLTSDHRVMLEEGQRIVEGLKILLHMFPQAQAYIGIEDNKMDAINELKKLIKQEENITVCTLHTKYPQGSEKHLIYAITGKQVPSGGLPSDVGCIVHNVDTIVAIWRAIIRGRPLMRRIVTISGDGVAEPANFKVRIGTSFKELLEAAKWDKEKTVKIIAGGPMMGTAMSDIDVPIIKGSSAILCFTQDEVGSAPMQNCIRCGKCVQVCPVSLVPHTLHIAALHEEYDKFIKYSGMDCIECGCCSYTCPAKRHLVQTFRTAKSIVRSKKKLNGGA